jgi:hypothetical protein
VKKVQKKIEISGSGSEDERNSGKKRIADGKNSVKGC